jgi:hypothetical protein
MFVKAIEEAGPLTPFQCLDGRALIALDGTKHLVHAAENPNPLWHVRPLAVCLSSSSGTALPWWH